MSTEPTVRRAAPEDRSAVAATVAAAFAEDPGWAFIFGDDYERLAAHFAAALFDVRVRSHNVWVADDVAAVAMWDAPDQDHGAAGYAASIWARYRAMAGDDANRRLAGYNDALAAVAPAERHWYLGVLATQPHRQRRGLATAVMAPVLEQADRVGIACCLETSTADNRRFYERRGFAPTAAIDLPGGPPTWWLRRGSDARAS